MPTLVLVGALALPGCTTAPARPAPTSASAGSTVLRMAQVGQDPLTDVTSAWFVTAVRGLSEGKVQVHIAADCCGGGADAEQRLIHAVAHGDYELGWVGTRAFADAGVDGLAPLTAPFLIDSYTLEKAVLQSPVAGRMAAAVAQAGVVGIALQPGLLRRPITSGAAPTSLADWRGIRFQVTPAKRSADAVAALGATPTQLGSAERDRALAAGTLGGVENGLASEARTPLVVNPRIALNEVLWPDTSAVIASPHGVTRAQAEVLRRAAATIVNRTGDLARLDAQAVGPICAAGGRFTVATPEHLASIAFATRAVLAAVKEAEPLPGQLEAIRDLKHGTTPEPLPPVPDACRS